MTHARFVLLVCFCPWGSPISKLVLMNDNSYIAPKNTSSGQINDNKRHYTTPHDSRMHQHDHTDTSKGALPPGTARGGQGRTADDIERRRWH